MDGKIRGSTFQWNWCHIQIPFVFRGNIETMRYTESITRMCYHILAQWAMYQVGPNRGTSLGLEHNHPHVLVVLSPSHIPP
jgi:hypothetical protein